MFVGSLFLFAVFALAAGFAKSAIAIDVLNGIMGLMSASGVPPAVGLLGVIYEKPSKRKNYAFACFSAGNPLGWVFGTILGGLATSLFGWRASYWLIAIIFVVFTVIGIFTIPRDFAAKEPFTLQTLKRFDILGTVLAIFGIGMFSAALSLGESAPSGWKTGYVLALLIVGLALMIGFVLWECWVKFPLVPMGIWRDRNFTLCLCILMLGFMAFVPGNFFVSLFLQEIWGESALMVAVHLLPMAVMGTIVNIVAGLILHKVSNKLLMLVGKLGYTGAFVLLSLNRESSSYWAFCFPAFILMVVGADLEFNVANMYVMSSMPPSQQSIAGGIFQTVTKLCTTLGFGIATAVFSSVQKNPRLSSYWTRTTQPFAATQLMALACSVLGLCLVPFLTLGTQGGKAKEEGSVAASEMGGDEKVPMDVEQKGIADATIAQALPTVDEKSIRGERA
jgi:MFS family permease